MQRHKVMLMWSERRTCYIKYTLWRSDTYKQHDMWSDKEAYSFNYDTADQTLIMTRQIKLQSWHARSNLNYDTADQT